jgi:predicted PhzF superfamily epimerase YddE/YHI9
MTFASLESLMQRCEEHLDATNTRNTEIESYFVQYLLVRICAEYEARVTTLVRRRCSRPRDHHLKSFAQKTAEYVCKHFAIGDIGKVLERFGSDYKQAFHGQVMSGMAHVGWDNIYTNRQAVAHTTGTQMSFGDLKQNYQDSLAVLDALVSALGLKPREVRDLT